jgi:hypothetical protein
VKLHGQQYIAVTGDGDSVAEVRTFNDKWCGDARISPKTVGQHATRDEACRALAKALRELADKVES